MRDIQFNSIQNRTARSVPKQNTMGRLERCMVRGGEHIGRDYYTLNPTNRLVKPCSISSVSLSSLFLFLPVHMAARAEGYTTLLHPKSHADATGMPKPSRWQP